MLDNATQDDRTTPLEQCQFMFDAFDSGITVSVKKGWAYLAWDYGFGPNKRRWDAREGSHFPTWRTGWGGTRSWAYDQLVRRLLGKSVMTMSNWRYAVEGPAKLGGHDSKIMQALTEVGWPEEAECILCKKLVSYPGDWWTIGDKPRRKSGPSCSMRDCRLPKPEAADAAR